MISLKRVASLLFLFAAIAMCLVVSDHTSTATPNQFSAKLGRANHGFWRIESDSDGVYWFVSPKGQREFLNTVTSVQPFQESRDPKGTSFRSSDWNGSNDPAQLNAWAHKAAQRIHAVGFKGIGAWSHPTLMGCDVPISKDLNLWACTPTGSMIFSTEWAAAVDESARTQVEKLKDNANLVGYFTDNERDWSPVSVGPNLHFDRLDAKDPNRAEVLKVIRNLWPALDALNSAWNAKFDRWEQVSAMRELPTIPQPAYDQLCDAWLEHLSIRYFTVTSAAVRKYDPNHLLLGVRFKGYAPPAVVRASRGLTDAQSINIYTDDAKLDRQTFEMLHRESGQPIVISEYSFHSLDNNSGNRNNCGFAALVSDQKARAEGYKVFTSRMASVPYIIGADWFQWNDEPPAGRGDGEDANFGVVDVFDKNYDLLVRAVQETTPTLNPRHAASPKASGEIWRTAQVKEATAEIHRVPDIVLDGDLSEWPASARFLQVHQTETIGSKELGEPPAAYAGWSEDGLYLAFQVNDPNVNVQGLTGGWWQRDCIEFWLWLAEQDAKRPAEFDRNSCQFVFFPTKPEQNAAGNPHNGVAGFVAQWHRPGDTLTQTLSPHPLVKQCTKMTDSGYTVEIFIPTAALPQHSKFTAGATIGFNFHIQDCERAARYYWSSDKGAQTQTRPDTWGTITLLDER